MSRFIDRLSEADKEKAKQWVYDRQHPKYATDIPPELYTIAELGFYYGWGAVESFYRGWIEDRDEENNLIKLPFNLETAVAFTRAAQKFHYRHALEQSKLTTVAMNSDKSSIENAFKVANKMREEI